MTTVSVEAEPWSAPKWLLIVSGIAWLLLALMFLSFDTTAAATIGVFIGILLILAAANEFIFMVAMPGWKWVHGILGVLFLSAGFASFATPLQTFGILSLFVGWYLLIKGFFDIATAIGFRGELPLWGLALAVGILEVLLGIWALGFPGRSAWLLLFWAGTAALFRGVGNLVAAFSHHGGE